jgi:hypothetical protein
MSDVEVARKNAGTKRGLDSRPFTQSAYTQGRFGGGHSDSGSIYIYIYMYNILFQFV